MSQPIIEKSAALLFNKTIPTVYDDDSRCMSIYSYYLMYVYASPCAKMICYKMLLDFASELSSLTELHDDSADSTSYVDDYSTLVLFYAYIL